MGLHCSVLHRDVSSKQNLKESENLWVLCVLFFLFYPSQTEHPRALLIPTTKIQVKSYQLKYFGQSNNIQFYIVPTAC